jgi:hypothetical protein
MIQLETFRNTCMFLENVAGELGAGVG